MFTCKHKSLDVMQRWLHDTIQSTVARTTWPWWRGWRNRGYNFFWKIRWKI